MKGFNYDSYCGIYCGACDIMAAYRTGEKRRLASFWSESMVKRFLKKTGTDASWKGPLEMKCLGCKTDAPFINCATCGIRRCAMESGVDHCGDCSKYPCGLIERFGKMRTLLPHVEDNRANMERIREVGAGRWLSEQEARWKCPGCGTAFSWYSSRCGNCGRDLKKLAFRFSFIRSVILKIGIYLMPEARVENDGR